MFKEISKFIHNIKSKVIILAKFQGTANYHFWREFLHFATPFPVFLMDLQE